MRRVVKLGGSLLTSPTLSVAVENWLARQPPAETFVIVGGGDVVNAVRRLDACCPLPADQVHWLCIELLRVTFDFARLALPPWHAIATSDQLQRLLSSESAGPARTFLVAVEAFYAREPAGCSRRSSLARSLPEDWRTTSDALAAMLAIEVAADELVLLKSCAIPAGTATELAALGIVDEVFPTLIDALPNWRIERLE